MPQHVSHALSYDVIMAGAAQLHNVRSNEDHARIRQMDQAHRLAFAGAARQATQVPACACPSRLHHSRGHVMVQLDAWDGAAIVRGVLACRLGISSCCLQVKIVHRKSGREGTLDLSTSKVAFCGGDISPAAFVGHHNWKKVCYIAEGQVCVPIKACDVLKSAAPHRALLAWNSTVPEMGCVASAIGVASPRDMQRSKAAVANMHACLQECVLQASCRRPSCSQNKHMHRTLAYYWRPGYQPMDGGPAVAAIGCTRLAWAGRAGRIRWALALSWLNTQPCAGKLEARQVEALLCPVTGRIWS